MRNLQVLLEGVAGESAYSSIVDFMFTLDKTLNQGLDLIVAMPNNKILTYGEREYLNEQVGPLNWAAINMPPNGLTETQRAFLKNTFKIEFINE